MHINARDRSPPLNFCFIIDTPRILSMSYKSLKKTGVKEKLVRLKEKLKAPIDVEKPLVEDPVELKIPVNKNICVVPIAHIDPKPKIEKIVEVPDKV